MIATRVGDCFQTFTGNPFYPLDPQPHEIEIDDIAHALSNICRFGGHCREFYSVAQHSVMVSRIVLPQFALQALLHDAAEAYVGDMVKPFKCLMPEFENAEEKVFAAIARRFNFPEELNRQVKAADSILLATEARDLMHLGPIWEKWLAGWTPLPERIRPLSAPAAEAVFMARFQEITEGSET